jgi:hypothetical protein
MDAPRERPSVPPPLPPRWPVQEAQPLHYARPGGARRDESSLPIAAGFGIGIALYLAAAACWWTIIQMGGGLGAVVWGLLGVPLGATLVATILQATLGWRGLLQGVWTAIGVTFLIGFFGILAICGFRW